MGRTGPISALACFATIVLTLLAAAVALLLPASSSGHGGNVKYRSEFRAIQPSVPGLQVDVLNYDDRLLLVNRSGKTVAITGYEREPYARLKADGTVEVNRRSPTHYLNEERYGGTPVPRTADPKAPPQWQTVGRTGRFEWHDHRIHWMSKDATPPQVKDEGQRTKVFDWRVPITVGSQRAGLVGTLFWQPSDSSGVPAAAVIALAALVVATLVLFLVTRRRRARAGQGGRQAW